MRRAVRIGGTVAVYVWVYLALGQATEAWQAWALFFAYGAHDRLTEPVEKAIVKDLVSVGLLAAWARRGTAEARRGSEAA